jgi:hypothetical protein
MSDLTRRPLSVVHGEHIGFDPDLVAPFFRELGPVQEGGGRYWRVGGAIIFPCAARPASKNSEKILATYF